jgi:3-oxoisoapionate decarboxylase
MGEGQIDQEAFFTKFDALCPGIAVHIETISGFNREMPYLTSDFWRAWPAMPAPAFARFLAIARQGKARPTFEPPAGQDRAAADQAYQKGEIERSIKYCKEKLGLGM